MMIEFLSGKYHINTSIITKSPFLTIFLFCKMRPIRNFAKMEKIGNFALRKKGREKMNGLGRKILPSSNMNTKKCDQKES